MNADPSPQPAPPETEIPLLASPTPLPRSSTNLLVFKTPNPFQFLLQVIPPKILKAVIPGGGWANQPSLVPPRERTEGAALLV